MEAVYDNEGTQNPLIEALPGDLDAGSFYRQIRCCPPPPLMDHQMALGERKQGLTVLPTVFVPLDYMYYVYDSLCRMLRSSYYTLTSRESVKRMNELFISDGAAGGYGTQAQSGALLGTPGLGKTSTLKRCLMLIPQVIAHEKYLDKPFFCKQVMPSYIDKMEFGRAERIAPPQEYVKNMERPRSEAQQVRYDLIKPALDDTRCITDEAHRKEVFRRIAAENNTTARRLRRLYYSYLARGSLTKSKPRESVRRMDFEEAIRKYYFSAKRNSLRAAYELFILNNYTNRGELADEIPSWSSFRQYYFRHFKGDPQPYKLADYVTGLQRLQLSRSGRAAIKNKVPGHPPPEPTECLSTAALGRSKQLSGRSLMKENLDVNRDHFRL